MLRVATFVWWLGPLLALTMPVRAAELTVFSAASLTDILPALARDYARDSGDRIRFSFGASSALARQIEAGASADVIVSADDDWMDYLAERDLLQPGTRAIVAGNRLVLIGARSVRTERVEFSRELDLRALLGDGRLALGDPAHVPAGRYAQAGLEKLGLWASVQDRLAPAESVRVALMYVVRGEAPLGFVYATDVRGVSAVRVLGELPTDPAAPIHYPAAALRRASSGSAAAFVTYLRSPAARAIWAAHGFTVAATSSTAAP
jgi:molybdate transport system substrate-binding protein